MFICKLSFKVYKFEFSSPKVFFFFPLFIISSLECFSSSIVPFVNLFHVLESTADIVSFCHEMIRYVLNFQQRYRDDGNKKRRWRRYLLSITEKGMEISGRLRTSESNFRIIPAFTLIIYFSILWLSIDFSFFNSHSTLSIDNFTVFWVLNQIKFKF